PASRAEGAAGGRVRVHTGDLDRRGAQGGARLRRVAGRGGRAGPERPPARVDDARGGAGPRPAARRQAPLRGRAHGALRPGRDRVGSDREGAQGRLRLDRRRRPGQAQGQDPARGAPRLLRRHGHPGAARDARDRAEEARASRRAGPGYRGGVRRVHAAARAGERADRKVLCGAPLSYRILVLEGITERGLELLKAEGWQIDQGKAMSPAELAQVIPPYDAMMIRSGTRVTEEALAPAAKLRIIGRPGVGVDNVDLDAATRRGIVVMNSPGGNIVSTAELTLALLLAVARPVAAADAAMKAERWDRKSFGGVELSGKRLGVVGLGRIGREVAARCRALGMEVVGYDPFVAKAVAEQLGVKLVSLDELLAGCDYVTLHTVLSADTRHLIGKDALAKVKPGIRIVNAARGELIDEAALLLALESGRVAGAALDVHALEPPKD